MNVAVVPYLALLKHVIPTWLLAGLCDKCHRPPRLGSLIQDSYVVFILEVSNLSVYRNCKGCSFNIHIPASSPYCRAPPLRDS